MIEIENILKDLKESIGDLSTDNSMDAYYKQQINIAYNDLINEDISETVLNSRIGYTAIVIYSQLLLNGKDVATNPTLIFLRNKLSSLTKGERLNVVK